MPIIVALSPDEEGATSWNMRFGRTWSCFVAHHDDNAA